MLFSRRPSPRLMLLIEVQSSLVRGSLVVAEAGAAPHIAYSERIELSYKPHAEPSYLVKTTMKAIRDAIDATARAARSADSSLRIAEVHYILSSPWVLSQARTVSVEFEKDTSVSEERIHRILESERAKIHGADDASLTAIEEKIFDIRLNGYSVSSWRDKSAKDVEISYAVTVASPQSVKRLREACERVAKGKRVLFHSSLLLQYVGLKSLIAGDDENCLLAHVHGELTDIVLVKNGTCVFFGSFPVGTDTIVRKLAKATKTDAKTADSLISLYLGKRLDDAHAAALSRVMDDMTKAWTGELGKLIRAGAPSGASPEAVILSAKSHEDFFAEGVRLVFAGSRIKTLAASDLAAKVSYEGLPYAPRLVSIYALGICDIM